MLLTSDWDGRRLAKGGEEDKSWEMKDLFPSLRGWLKMEPTAETDRDVIYPEPNQGE